MKYRRLGSSNLNVSIMAFGAWQLGDPAYWGADAETNGQAAVDTAIDTGITLFDTAESYGNGESERALGKALGTKRDQVLVASKVSPDHCAPAMLSASCEASLERLGTDRIDLYQVHWPFHDVSFEDAFGELARLKDEGKIREIGVSNFGPVDLGKWIAAGGCVSNQLGYNLLFRAIEHEIVPACIEHNTSILAYMPLLQGILSGRWKNVDDIPANRRRTRHFAGTRPGVRHGEAGCEALLMDALQEIEVFATSLGAPMAAVAMAWLMAQPGVTSVIVGARNPAQVRRNVAAASLELDPAALARLSEITDPLKQHLGTNPDLWCNEKDCRIH